MADEEKPSFLRVIAKAVAYGTTVGTAFYVLGGVANPVMPAITAAGLAVVGFASGFSVALSDAF